MIAGIIPFYGHCRIKKWTRVLSIFIVGSMLSTIFNAEIFGGGGGTILPKEIQSLHRYGITKIYHPDDGRKMGLQGNPRELLVVGRVLADTVKTMTGEVL